MRLVVVIPAYQAAATLPSVVQRVLASNPDVAAVCIINDGSTDATAGAAESLAVSDSRVSVVHRPRNGGYGAAMKDGLAAARALEADVVGCVHADGQYAPEVLPRLVEVLSGRALDLVQGSRIASGTALSGGMPRVKYVANRGLTRLGNLVFGMRMSDYYSGYLVYGARAMTEVPWAGLSDGFEFDLEVIASARSRGLRIGEAPVPTHYGDEVSHLRPIPYGLRVLRVLWRYKRGDYDARSRTTAG
jgi:glycosyltransferase involved in cell wall biosynthesis